MLTKKSLALVLATGTLCPVVALANDNDRLDLPSIRKEAPRSYGSRANQVVYATPIDVPGSDWRSMGTTLRVAGDDIGFSPGPGAAGGIAINGAAFATVQAATGTDNSQTLRLSFYDNFLGTSGVAGTFPASGFPFTNLLGQASWDLTNFNTPGFITFYDVPIDFTVGQAPVAVPDANCGLLQEIFTIGTTTYHPTIYAVGRGNQAAHVVPGSSNGQRWTDNNNNLLIDTGELNAGGAGNFRALYSQLRADVPPPPAPTGTVNLGTLSGSLAVPCVNLASDPDNIAWYQVTISADATDANRRWLDIDTEATAGGADVTIAVYDAATGNLATPDASDRGSGSGTNSQLSFGIGRRAAVLDGVPYDGRSGQLVAGTYIIGVAPGGSAFAGGYTVATGGSVAPGNACLTLAEGDDSAPSVAPTNLQQDLGCVTAPGVAPAPLATPRRQVLWYKFQTNNLTVNGSEYLDIDFSLTQVPADGQAAIWDNCGILIATSDDAAAGYLQPQFSFGSNSTLGGTATPRPGTVANQPAFDGQDGQLVGGTYYMSVGLFQLTGTINGSNQNDRWHVRSTSGSSLEVPSQFFTNSTSCVTCHGCCVADYDDGSSTGTPDGGVGIEDLLYYLGLYDAGSTCADVDAGAADGTMDGGVGIEDLLYYLQRYDAGC